MKVVLFDTGSFVQWVIPLANSLSKSNDIILIIPNTTSEDFLQQISPKVNLQIFEQTRIRNPKSFLVTAEIINKIIKFGPDIIHIQSHGGLWFSIQSFFLRKHKIVNEVHDIIPHIGDQRSKNKGYSVMSFFAKYLTSHYVVHGKNLKKQLTKEYNIDKNKVSIIPLGNLSIYQKPDSKSFDEVPNMILFFGRIWRYKGLEFLIKSEPLISKIIPNLKIVIAGEGESFDKYDKMIINRDNFLIKNYRIPNEELSELFQKAAVVVLPYIEATQSGIISIAFAYGKPVVITNVGSLSEVVEDGKHGFVVTPRDEKALAEAIIRLLEDNDLRNSMGRNAHLCGKTNLSWDQIAQTSIEIYNKTLSPR
jgi:glycosyltransferase involved in cell wall biosynthesis